MSVTIVGMKLLELERFVRFVPHVAVFFLCLGFLLYPHQLTYSGIGNEAFVPTIEYAPHADASVPSDEHPPTGNYLAFAPEETENESKAPVNVEYLTALLTTVFLGVVLGLLFGSSRTWCSSRVSLLVDRRLPSVTCSPPRGPTNTLLSVFLL